MIAYDPVVKNDKSLHDAGKFEEAESLDAVLNGADAVVLVTKWNEFADLPKRISDGAPASDRGRDGQFLRPLKTFGPPTLRLGVG